MRETDVILAVVDISGYTGFTRLHRFSQMHAEMIVNDLLDTVLAETDGLLELNKLQGDAALLYVEDDGGEALAAEVVDRLERGVQRFREREAELVRCNACVCEACLQADQLRLKAFVHRGRAIVKELRDFEELAGEDVILVHRLMKNDVPVDEYILATEVFAGATPRLREARPHVQRDADLGEVSCRLWVPDAEQRAALQRRPTVGDKIRGLFASLWMDLRFVGRWITGRRRRLRARAQTHETPPSREGPGGAA